MKLAHLVGKMYRLLFYRHHYREYECGESCFHGEKFIRVGKLCKNRKK